ncbi:alginate export family protein [Limnoglobus roseus]|uniref:alginate export family protein n=1 Tax=Limnoglobus roseus TaxID=2598579 RepID=UPI00143CDC5E|nr:alginate export family protein [Limnoglobus roseus]
MLRSRLLSLALGGGVLIFNPVSAQEPVAPAAEQPPAAAAENAAGPITGGGQRSFSGPTEKPKAKKSFWETVPSIQPYPRAGNFNNAPTGPGYYTILDAVRGNLLKDRPKNPYLQWGQNPNPFFNVDFRYLDAPDNKEHFAFDSLKRIHLTDNLLFSTGGELRDRFATIQNPALFNRNPGAGSRDNFNLFRTRIYGDLTYRDDLRLFAEFITAESSNQTIPLAASDVGRADFLNLFVQAKVATLNDEGVYLRAGRQELLFGSQRLIAPSDWANVRRTFQGLRGSWQGKNFEQDLFVVQPVVPDPGKISSVNGDQLFVGEWFKYRFSKNVSTDLYYLYLENGSPTAAKGRGGVTGSSGIHTIGNRFVGEKNGLLWDFENAIQFGRYANQQTLAGISVTGVGYYFKDLPASPTVWAYYDYASGDPHPGVGDTHHTFNTLFPFGHSYYAGLDSFGRQNLNDFHLEASLFPWNWLRIQGGYHILRLDQPKDALYSTSGGVVRQDTTGKAGTDVGQALTGAVQFHLDNHQSIVVQYSHLFSGDFIRNTAVNRDAAKDLSALWVQYTAKW